MGVAATENSLRFPNVKTRATLRPGHRTSEHYLKKQLRFVRVRAPPCSRQRYAHGRAVDAQCGQGSR